MQLFLLCALGLLALVQAQQPSPDELRQYTDCYEYALCTDTTMRKQLVGCLSPLAPKELQSLFKDFKSNYFPVISATISGAIDEYCGSKPAEQKKEANKVIDADAQYQNKNSESIENQLEQATNCAYKIAKQLRSDGKC